MCVGRYYVTLPCNEDSRASYALFQGGKISTANTKKPLVYQFGESEHRVFLPFRTNDTSPVLCFLHVSSGFIKSVMKTKKHLHYSIYLYGICRVFKTFIKDINQEKKTCMQHTFTHYTASANVHSIGSITQLLAYVYRCLFLYYTDQVISASKIHFRKIIAQLM